MPSAPRKILIIGSSGFIGSHLTEALVKKNYEVYGFDKKPPRQDFGLTKFTSGDILDRQQVAKALDGIDTVINLAAVHFDFGHTDAEYWETNETGAKILTELMGERQIQRLIFTSSMAVYGDRDDVADEATEPTPTSVYGASKLAAEKVIRQWSAGDAERAAVMIRPSVVYGERNIANMANLIRQVHSGFFVLVGGGENVKATAYVGNLVAMLIGRLESMTPGVQLYNYADKPDLPVREIVGIIRQALGKSPRPLQFPMWLGVALASPFDWFTKITGKQLPVSKARVLKLAKSTQMNAQRIRDAGFRQPVTTEEGIRRMVKHFLEERAKNKK